MDDIPRGLEMKRFHLGDVELVVLDYPLAEGAALLQERLTATQRAIALLALEGYANRDIALRRAVSEKTVSKHLAAVYQRLGVSSRAELAALIATDELPQPPTPRSG